MQIVDQIRTIERLGHIDPLTDIPNRRNFNERLSIEWRKAIREKLPISFLMMDVDHFKIYNDTYGHPQGDLVLQTVAKIFASSARRPSDLAARLGGEEFGVLLPNTSLEGALSIAENIRLSVEIQHITISDGHTTASVTISIGVHCRFPKDGDTAEDFIAKADQYLYIAKSTGRNRVYFGESDTSH
jgi:diguanylate cyclase (GGDEF)-like protein